eukprot:6213209-Pleurochrysis_carterae.AAC.5
MAAALQSALLQMGMVARIQQAQLVRQKGSSAVMNGAARPKNVLVTGAAGFIASHLVTRLATAYPHYKASCLPRSGGPAASVAPAEYAPWREAAIASLVAVTWLTCIRALSSRHDISGMCGMHIHTQHAFSGKLRDGLGSSQDNGSFLWQTARWP